MTRFFFSLLLIACTGTPFIAFSQSQLAFLERSLASNDIAKRLPPLDTLLKAAEQFSPLLKEQDANIAIAKINEEMQRRAWLDFFAINLGWSYGQFDALTVNPDAAVGVATTTSSQNRYTLGASFKMPLSAPIKRSNEIQLTKIEQEQVRYRIEYQRIELRKTIITMYQSLIQAHRLLLISNNSLETLKLHAKRAEREFLDGLISIGDYTRMQESLVSAMSALESQKMAFITAYLILEETTGIKLNL